MGIAGRCSYYVLQDLKGPNRNLGGLWAVIWDGLLVGCSRGMQYRAMLDASNSRTTAHDGPESRGSDKITT